MITYVIAYVASVAVFLAIDFVWIGFLARGFYFEKLGHLLLEQPKLGAAAGFYAVYVIGIVFFAVTPALRDDSLWVAVLHGALFGMFAYATYDMTNYATLRDWPVSVVVVDIAWGTLLSAVAAAAGFLAARAFPLQA